MKNTAKIMALLLAMILVLTGCGGKKPASPAPSAPAAPSAPEAPAAPEVKAPAYTENRLQTEEDLLEFLEGTWDYTIALFEDYPAQITFNSDYTYSVAFAEGSGFDGCDYEGEFSFERFWAESGAPDLLCLGQGKGCAEGDPGFFGGDFLIGSCSAVYDTYSLALVQANNGDSMFSSYFWDFEPLFTRADRQVSEAEPVKSSTFDGLLWNVDFSDAMLRFHIADLDAGTELTPCATYVLGENNFKGVDLPLDFDNAFVWPVRVETDEKGDLVSVDFYQSAPDFAIHGAASAADEVRGYVLDFKDYTVWDDTNTIYAYTSLPRFLGSSRSAQDLNAAMADIADSYVPGLDADLQECLEDLKEYPYDHEFYHSPINTEDVYMEYCGPISVSLVWDWYMGGVYNTGYQGINYDPFTHSFLTLEDFMGMDKDTLDQLIAEALDDEYGIYPIYILEELEDYCWWFDEENVYVGFDSYALEDGASSHCISLSRY